MRVHIWSRLFSVLAGVLILGSPAESSIAQTPRVAIQGQVPGCFEVRDFRRHDRASLQAGAKSGESIVAEQSGSFIVEAEPGVYEIQDLR